ncbi:flagellar hook assembly protein FlgD [Limnoglobus roseus]|uniref:Basal-body rod modification protein FlgD n=1 Tax=Limnoglobus roseus TaxID=2598579 RepID=A0A5C1A4J2_9BACT|nr:flagellar hook capping FlgD N-terminal domain-containing protein [Limnoglobus roseus]QEL13307.1 flagellar hook capping protein [Limnoglobus roseus]
MSQIASATSSAISQDQFLNLLVTQLQNQDPLDPVSDQNFITQLTQLNTLTSLQSLNASFSENLKLQQLTQGADLVGRTVQYTPADGNTPATGTVSSVAVENGQFVLKIGTASVGLDSVLSVQ